MASPITFTEDNVKKNALDFPKVKLALNERARLSIVENPIVEYYHQIQKPVLDDNNQVVMKTVEKKDGTEYTTPKLSWVSTVICLGTESVLADKGIDPDNCPVCKRAADGQKGFFPKRRFIVHVIKTNTKPGSFEPTKNSDGSLSTQVLIWSFTETIFNKLVEFQTGFGLTKHDINYGPCTDADFQKAEVNIAPDTALDEAARKNIFTEDSKAPDPSAFAGMRKTKERLEDDLAIVDEAWAKSKGGEVDQGSSVTSAAALSEGLASLLDEDDTTSGATTVTEPVADLDSLVEGTTVEKDAEGWAKEAPAESKPAAESSSKELNVEDILNSL